MDKELTRPNRKELIKLKAYRKEDTIFASNARLLQSKWRKEQLKLEEGSRINKGEEKFWGNLLPEGAAKAGYNFLTDTIRKVVEDEIKSETSKTKLIEKQRMLCNMLSSQPLCFNLFGELKDKPDIATKIFKKLLPKTITIDKISCIKFEHSPRKKNNTTYLGDKTAFDVFVEYFENGDKCFLGIEVKYTEALREESKKTAENNYKKHPRYKEITEKYGKFKLDFMNKLKIPPLSQIWRDHLLSIALEKEGEGEEKYKKGHFVFLYPSKNKECKDGIDEYKKYLTDQNSILDIHLEKVIDEIGEEIKEGWAKDLKSRYLGE